MNIKEKEKIKPRGRWPKTEKLTVGCSNSGAVFISIIYSNESREKKTDARCLEEHLLVQSVDKPIKSSHSSLTDLPESDDSNFHVVLDSLLHLLFQSTKRKDPAGEISLLYSIKTTSSFHRVTKFSTTERKENSMKKNGCWWKPEESFHRAGACLTDPET